MIWKKVAAHAECAPRVTTKASATGSGGGRPRLWAVIRRRFPAIIV